MTSPESGHERIDEQAVVKDEINLLAHTEKPSNELEAQMVLAEELYLREHTDTAADAKSLTVRNIFMEEWISSGYSAAFRKLRERPDFVTHSRLHGDPTAITLSDIDTFRATGVLPER